MTIKHPLFYSSALLLAVVFFSQCKKRCGEGYINVDHECLCPEGKFEAYGTCRELEPNEFYGTLDDCPCNDTIYFKILGHTASSLHYTSNYKGSVIVESYLNYYPLPSGDSIVGPGSSGGYVCDINGWKCNTYWVGKFDGPDRINMKAYYYKLSSFPLIDPPLDSCKFTFRR